MLVTADQVSVSGKGVNGSCFSIEFFIWIWSRWQHNGYNNVCVGYPESPVLPFPLPKMRIQLLILMGMGKRDGVSGGKGDSLGDTLWSSLDDFGFILSVLCPFGFIWSLVSAQREVLPDLNCWLFVIDSKWFQVFVTTPAKPDICGFWYFLEGPEGSIVINYLPRSRKHLVIICNSRPVALVFCLPLCRGRSGDFGVWILLLQLCTWVSQFH